MKIDKIENMGGIRKLNRLENLNGNAIIYAPNGGCKTSLAYGFNAIANGSIPEERISGTSSVYDITLNEKKYTNKNSQATNAILVYNFETYQDSRITDSEYAKKYSLLTVSKRVKNLYDKEYEECANAIETLKNIVSPIISGKKKDAISKTEDFFASCLEKNNWNDIIFYLTDLNWDNIVATDIPLLEILNSNTKAIISDDSFTDKVKKLDESIKSRALTNLFGDIFGPSEAGELMKI